MTNDLVVIRKHDSIEIDPDAPFANDKLDRRQFVELLTLLISTISQPFVIGVDGPWGSGKTTFLRMCSGVLQSRGHSCFYFNAWENDFADDPLIAFLSEIDVALSKQRVALASHPRIAKVWNQVKTVGETLASTIGPTAIQIAAHGFVSAEQVRRAAKRLGQSPEDVAEASGDISKLAKSVAEHRLTAHRLQRKSIRVFRRYLEKFAIDLGEREGQRLPIVILVDELDRCRPTYAVALLERIKHIFSVPGVLFVLAMDKEQLGHSLRTMYGAATDVDGYLRRFIDLTCHLPEPRPGAYSTFLFERFALASLLRRFPDYTAQSSGTLHEIFAELARLFRLSLRDQEQFVSEIALALRLTPPQTTIFPILLIAYAVLRSETPDCYRRYVVAGESAEPIIAAIRERPGGDGFLNSDPGIVLRAQLIAFAGNQTLAADLAARAQRSWAASEILDRAEHDRQQQLAAHVVHLQRPDRSPPWARKYTADQLELTVLFTG